MISLKDFYDAIKEYFILVGSISRGKLNVDNIDLISLLPINKAIKLLKNIFGKINIGQKGNKQAVIQIKGFDKIIYMWYSKENEFPYAYFRLAYPQQFVARISSVFKKEGYKFNNHGIFDKNNKKKFGRKIKSYKDIFKVLQHLGYNYEYRSPAVEQRKELEGGGVYQTLANAYRSKFCQGKARPLLDGEMHPGCNNFMGPGTRIDLQEVRDYEPYDCPDAVSKQHDLDYYKVWNLPPEEKKKGIREADLKMLSALEKCPPSLNRTIAQSGIGAKVGIEKVAPFNILGQYSGGKKVKDVEGNKVKSWDNEGNPYMCIMDDGEEDFCVN